MNELTAQSLLRQIRSEWPVSLVGTDQEIDGGNVVDWLGTLAERIDSALGATIGVYRISVKHTADDGYETHPEAVIEVIAEDAHSAYMQVEGLLLAGGDVDEWDIGVLVSP